jgi:prolyl-tRNA editing enzyme YbaK/EbsC (Cys-tRNA(Pro) deacylase)
MIPEKVRSSLQAHGLAAIEFEPGSTPTAPLAARALDVRVGQIAKSILLVGKDGRFYLAVCPGDRRISSSKLKKVIGVKTRMGNPEETLQATGFLPGGVCPFGLTDLPILLDEHLAEYERIYPAAGTDASAVEMTFPQLERVTGGRVCDLTDGLLPPGPSSKED